MTCIIIDDEYPARRLLEDYVSRIPDLEHLKSFRNAMEAKEFITSHEVDLMFLDIQMPQQTGMDLLKNLEKKPMAIMITAYHEYALEGYELDVVDYLVKPVSFERFQLATQKALRRMDTKIPEASTADHLLIRADHKIHKVLYDEIIYIEGAREYVIYHLESGMIMALESLRNLEETLPENFVRIHKSYIVNKKCVTALHGSYVEIGDKNLPVGKNYRLLAKKIF